MCGSSFLLRPSGVVAGRRPPRSRMQAEKVGTNTLGGARENFFHKQIRKLKSQMFH